MCSNRTRTCTFCWTALRKSIVTRVFLVGIQQSKDLSARESSQLPPPTIAEEIRRRPAEIQHGEIQRRKNKSSQQTSTWTSLFSFLEASEPARPSAYMSAKEALRPIKIVSLLIFTRKRRSGQTLLRILNLLDEEARFFQRFDGYYHAAFHHITFCDGSKSFFARELSNKALIVKIDQRKVELWSKIVGFLEIFTVSNTPVMMGNSACNCELRRDLRTQY